jgi:hypothetical protein
MITEIGIVAGDIWHYLDENAKVKLEQLVKHIDRPRDTILMSVGWLAREGHVVVEGESPDCSVSLRK